MELLETLGLFLGIVGSVAGFASAAFKFLNRRKNTRKEFLKELNAMYRLFEDGANFVYGYNRQADKAALIRELAKSVKAIETFYTLNDDPDALTMFFKPYRDLTAHWDMALNANWSQWCDSAKGSAFKNGTQNWDAFSMSKFYGVYDATRKNLNALRQQVRDSIS